MMITDYSSVALDFAYMKKPVVFYQFDVKRYREAQYQEGYLDYQTCGLGSWQETEDGAIEAVVKSARNGFRVDEAFEKAHAAFFPLYDDKNCERIYRKLRKISHE